jgi:hypothetical protein
MHTVTTPVSMPTEFDAELHAIDSISDEAKQDYWFEYIDEKVAAKFRNHSERTLQGWRLRGGGPRYYQLSPKLIRYRRYDLRADAEACARYSTSDTGGSRNA